MYPEEPKIPLREFMIWWNTQFPIDYWYRRKYEIAFNSAKHRELSLFDILCEWEEENLTIELQNELYNEEQFKDYKETGRWLRDNSETASQEDWDEFFESDNWDEFDDDK